MPLTPSQAQDAAVRLMRSWSLDIERVERIDRYLRGDQEPPYQPRVPNDEYRKLVSRARSNWLPLVVSAQAQALYVEGYRSSGADANAAPWDAWQANGLDRRQSQVYRSALGYGSAFVTVLPGDTAARIRGVSPRRMWAEYEDPAEDDWPLYAVQTAKPPRGLTTTPDGRWRVRVLDEVNVYELMMSGLGSVPELLTQAEHGQGVCPVVRFTDGLDLDGRARGQVEPLMPLQDRINQTAFDLLLAQTYGAFKVRTVSGASLPEGEDGTAAALQLAVNRMLTAPDPDTKFGTLDETPLGGYIESLDTAVRHLAAISQTPPHHLLGQMANLSAEALAAAEAGLTRKVEEHKHSFGESWEQVLRLAALAQGDAASAADESAQVVWRDTESRSLAQTADALGKLATQLGIPVQALWERIPGVTQTDVTRWAQLAAAADPMARLDGLLDAPPALDPAELKQRADAMGVLIRAGVEPTAAAQQAGLDGMAFTGAVPSSLRLPQGDAAALEQQ